MRPHNKLIPVGILHGDNHVISCLLRCVLTSADGGMGKWADTTTEVTLNYGKMITARLLLIMAIYVANLGDPTEIGRASCRERVSSPV